MGIKTQVRSVVAALAVVSALAACGTGANTDSEAGGSKTSSTADISEGVQPDAAAVKLLPQSFRDKGELTVAMDLHYPPTTFLADDNSTPIGLNPDIARLVAKKLGLKLKFENTGFDTIIPGIDGGRYDFTVTTMAPTPERLNVLDMIDYFNGGISVAVSTGNPLKISNEDMCGRNIAVTKGSTGQLKHLPNVSEWTCTSKGKPAINAITLPNVQEALTQLASKRIDGVFYDTASLVWAAKQQPDTFTILSPQVDTRSDNVVAIGLKKGSSLTPALQRATQSVLESSEYKKSLSNWGLESGAITQAKLN